MPSRPPKLALLPFALATLLGAFLVFQVQPVISKVVLPWFGGAPMVWTTCMLFFQVLLFGGYLYAHLLARYLPPPAQGAVHVLLLATAVLAMPITPDASWRPDGSESPAIHLLLMLLLHVGLPYFALSSTGPLIQSWLSLEPARDDVYRLYALSNVGSLSALLSYPLIVEPVLAVDSQSRLWGLLFAAFVLIQGWLATRLIGRAPETARNNRGAGVSPPIAPSRVLLWLALPAFASIVLLAFTNHLCQEVAVVPFLWVLPLAIYLTTFILAFDSPGWYRPRGYAYAGIATIVAATLIQNYAAEQLVLQIAACGSLVFLLCMLCHGEVARLRPAPSQLTAYYLALSAGGALGALFVAVLCPLVFDSYLEFTIAQSLGAILFLVVALGYGSDGAGEFRQERVQRLALLGSLVALAGAGLQSYVRSSEADTQDRNFFGVLRVLSEHPGTKSLVHGQTVHGLQIAAPRHREPTMYYGIDSGIGRLLQSYRSAQEAGDSQLAPTLEPPGLRARVLSSEEPGPGNPAPQPLRVGTIGLGIGTLAAYGRSGDEFDFYEINGAVEQLAREHFSFLDDCPAAVDVTLGDGRLALERRPQVHYDVLVLDAFSSDSVPAHLLTTEAMQLYRQRLKPGGVIAFHISNRFLDLEPVVHRLAASIDATSRTFTTAEDGAAFTSHAVWVLVATDPRLWQRPELSVGVAPRAPGSGPLWTDNFHNLLDVLR